MKLIDRFIYVFRNIFFIVAVITLVNWIFIIPVNVLGRAPSHASLRASGYDERRLLLGHVQ